MKNRETLNVSASGEREIVMTRTFDAPRNLVFDAFTKPELIKRWLLGPGNWTMVVCNVDLRVGGSYRFVLRSDRNGTEMGWGGVYREIAKPERLAHTEQFDQAWYPGESLITSVFAEKQSKTNLTVTILYESAEARDTVLRSNMKTGVAASYDRLEEVLEANVAAR
jgi:uncharacterized protein YndB with AHSA1/START domain